MVDSIQYTSPRVCFGNNDDLLSAPQKFAQQESVPTVEVKQGVTELDLSTKSEKPAKKGSIGKTILKTVAGLLVAAGALFGLYKWKGVHGDWINKEASGWLAKAKNWLMKPGELIDNHIVKPISNKITAFRSPKVDELVEDIGKEL